MNFLTSAITDVGISKQTNQDSLLLKSANTKIGNIVLGVICDGMGGLSKGELASATVIKAFSDWFNTKLPQLIEYGIEDDLLVRQLTNLIREQNQLVMNYGKSAGINLGTTVCAILITEDRYCCVNVGDSRCYEISDDYIQMTKDQTLVQREIDYGILTPEQAKVDPRRSVLLQCVGCNENVNPEFCFGTPKPNATYMLCSDGFRHEITEEEIKSKLHPNLLLNKDNINTNAIELIELNKSRGETDNITTLIIRTY